MTPSNRTLAILGGVATLLWVPALVVAGMAHGASGRTFLSRAAFRANLVQGDVQALWQATGFLTLAYPAILVWLFIELSRSQRR